jgi:hypothetical protein
MSGLATSKYHVSLNGQGYVLIEESRRKRSQQPFNPRFSTGDPSLTDLSFWQFLTQESWDGGSGQLDFETTNKIQKAYGWSLLTGKPRLAGGCAATSGMSSIVQLPDKEAASGTDLPYIHGMFNFGRKTDARPVLTLVGPKDDYTTSGAFATLRTASSSIFGIQRFQGAGGFVWRRGSPNSRDYTGYLMCGYDAAGTATLIALSEDLGTRYTNSMAGEYEYPRCIIDYDQDTLLAFGKLVTTNSEDCLYIARFGFDANAWTLGGGLEYGLVADVPSIPSPHACKDSSGTFYIVCPGESILTTAEQFGSYVVLITAADAAIAAAPRASSVVPYPGFFLTGAVSINGTAYLIGCKMTKGGSSPTFRSCVIKYPYTVIWESDHSSTTLDNVVPRAIHQASRNEAYFVDRKLDSGEFQAIMRLTLNDVVEPVAQITPDATGSRIYPAALCRAANTFFIYDVSGNTMYSSTIDPTASRSSGTLKLRTSRFGGNTPLINKTLYSVAIELSEAVTSGETLTIKANGTTVGTMVNADGTSKTITLTTEVTGPWFEIYLEMPHTATSVFEVLRVTLKYVPTQFKKKAFSIGIRATGNLKLIDGSKEGSTPSTLVSALWTAYASNVPITFIDIDGTSYTVLVTDIDERAPLIDTRGGSKLEALVFLELLEV